MKILEVRRPGLFTTIQDEGRPGFMKYGVPLSGALDLRSMRAANAALGNPRGAAVLEITMVGPELHAVGEVKVSIAGALFEILVNESLNADPVVHLFPGDVLRFHRLLAGCRAYLAVSAGFDVPLVMGSRSTYVPARMGGHEGRPLEKGDVLSALRPLGNGAVMGTSLDLATNPTIRVSCGPEFNLFSDEAVQRALDSSWTVSSESNRMGLRLEGPDIGCSGSGSMITTGLMPGSVQVPGGGSPIVILRDGQTTGGYPRIFNVLAKDLDVLAQIRGGESFSFILS